MKTLPELQSEFGFQTDKSDANHTFQGRSYLDVYDKLFQPLRDVEMTVVEIGVLFGGSLRLWQQYFSKAHIIGIDIDPSAQKYVPDGVQFVNVSQTDESTIVGELLNRPKLGLVIDDGSHYVPHMIASFGFLWPLVMDNGIYVIEDTRITYHGVDSGWPGMTLNQEPFADNRRSDIDQMILSMTKTMDNCQGDVRAIELHPMIIAFHKAGSVDKAMTRS